jgi:predicted permease
LITLGRKPLSIVDAIAQDLRFTIRSLRRSPGFACTAIATLAVGIGGNTAMFSIVNAVILQPLPYRAAENLASIQVRGAADTLPAPPALPGPPALVSGWAFEAWRERASHLGDIVGFNGPRPATVVVGNQPRLVETADVTQDFFTVLGVSMAAGRGFLAEDEAAPPAVVSHEFWTRALGEDRAALDRTMVLNGDPIVIVGILPRGFRFPTLGWRPVAGLESDTQPDIFRLARPGILNAIVRLAPDARADTVASELLAILRHAGEGRMTRTYLDRQRVEIVPLHRALVGNAGQRLFMLLGVVTFVLLVVCANVANLLLGRLTARHRELAVRAALGAGRRRLTCLVLTESLVLAAAGAALAVAVTLWARGAMASTLVSQIPHVREISFDWRVLAFNIALATVTGVLCGLASVAALGRVNAVAGVSAAWAAFSSATVRTRASRTLLALQIGASLVLVLGAALMLQSLWNLTVKEDGFNASGVMTLRVAKSTSLGTDRDALSRFFEDLAARLRRVPGVVSTAAVSDPPLGGGTGMGMGAIAFEGEPEVAPEAAVTSVAAITPGYFRTIGIAFRAGRDFDPADRTGSARVAIVNEAFARRFAPSIDILDRRIRFSRSLVTVVGLVADVPDRSLREAPRPMIFTPLAQMSAGPFGWGRLTMVVRTTGEDPTAIASRLRQEVWSVDQSLIVDDVASMSERIAASLRNERQNATLFALFAILAVTVAAIGVYGVAAYSVVRRTREIGVRMALGADARGVVRLIVSEMTTPMLAGMAIGIPSALMLTRMIAAMLYGVSPGDPATLVAASAAIAAVALVAIAIPARRAARIDPSIALRQD